MAKRVKRPVKVNGIEFDALISSENTLEATVPEYAVEDGYSVSDNIILGAETLKLVLFLTDTPVTWRRRSGHEMGHVENVVQKLRDLYYGRELCTINTSEKTYTNMAIESMTISKSLETGYAKEIPISFRQIRITTTSTTTIPGDYGKSGATQESAGTASTTAGSAGGSGSSGSSGGSGNSGKSRGKVEVVDKEKYNKMSKQQRTAVDNMNALMNGEYQTELQYMFTYKKPESNHSMWSGTGIGGLSMGNGIKENKVVNNKAKKKKTGSEGVVNLLGSE